MPDNTPPGATPIDLGPRQVARRIVVNTPATEIFARLSDPHQHAALDGSGTVRANVSGPTRMVLGNEFVTSMKMFGLPYKTTSTVTACENPTLVEWEPGGSHRWRWELRELDDHTTEVTEVFDYRESSGARMLEFLGIPGRNARGIEATLTSLRDQYADVRRQPADPAGPAPKRTDPAGPGSPQSEDQADSPRAERPHPDKENPS